jgi:Glycosyl transferase family 2
MKVSVILPVFNCKTYVGEAIESILNQKFQDFEFLIIDDGSTDGTPGVLAKYTDPRIRHYRHENRGLAATLNIGISLAQGKYIARQDQDDISLPERLEKQVAFMASHPRVALLGTWAQIMEGDRLVERYHRHPCNEAVLKYQLLFNNYFVHSSVMMRREVVEAIGGYCTDSERQPPEDYELWSRVARVAGVANLPEVLLNYREIPGSMSRQGPSPFKTRLVKLCAENIALAAGLPCEDSDVLSFSALMHGAPEMVFPKTDWRRLEKVLRVAAEKATGVPLSREIQAEINNRINALKMASMVFRGPLGEYLSKQGMVCRILKGAYRRISGV